MRLCERRGGVICLDWGKGCNILKEKLNLRKNLFMLIP